MSKYVYFFGAGKAEGRADMKELLGGKGGQPRRDDQYRPARAGRLHHHHRGLHLYYYATARPTPRSSRPRSTRPCARPRRPWAPSSAIRRTRCSSPAAPAPASHARHDGHRAQHRPERTRRSQASIEAVRQRALRLGQLSPLRADVRRRRARHEAARPRPRSIRSRRSWTSSSTPSGVKLDTELDVDDLKELVKRVQEGGQGQAPARTSPTIRWSRCGAPSAPCSARG